LEKKKEGEEKKYKKKKNCKWKKENTGENGFLGG